MRKGFTLNIGGRLEIFVSRADAQEKEVLYFKRRLNTLTYTKDYTLKSIRRRVHFIPCPADFCALRQAQGSFFSVAILDINHGFVFLGLSDIPL